MAKVVVESCAYIGSGNILKINEFMSKLNKKVDPEDELTVQEINLGLIGMALIAVSEDVGRKMLIRNIHHILQYCHLNIKRTVPIMLAILGIYNFNVQVTDLLYKLAHDDDKEMAL